MSDWVKVSDQLPPNLVRVIAYWLDGRMAVGWFNGGPFVMQDVGHSSYPPLYWRYLPMAPERVLEEQTHE